MKSLVWIWLLALPLASASSFTGVFSDYGKDSGTDGLFNFLVVEAEADITSTKDYLITGFLEDSSGRNYEFSECKDLASTGRQRFILQFDGLSIYRNKASGAFKLAYIELSSVTSCQGFGMPPEKEASLEYAYTAKSYTYTQFQTGRPAITCKTSPCLAGPELIKSKDKLAVPEPNSPNTIDGCEDGSIGVYAKDESIESINAASTGGIFRPGSTVNVEMQVYCSKLSDRLNFVYSGSTNPISWQVKSTKKCTKTGLSTLSAAWTLDQTVGSHAIRGVFGYNEPVDSVCSKPGYDDSDDIVLEVVECNQDSDCSASKCNLDGCYAGTYRDYADTPKKCISNSCAVQECRYSNISTDADADGFDTQCDNDCDDEDREVAPDAREVCSNGKDDDCDGKIDSMDSECQGSMISLRQGWNLISLPGQDAGSISSLFDGKLNRILALEGDVWRHYDGTLNSNLAATKDTEGIWVELSSPVQIQFQAPKAATFPIKKGLNLISYPSTKENYASVLFNDVKEDIEIIYLYDGSYKSFNPKRPAYLMVLPGMGILVKSKVDTTWYFDSGYKKSMADSYDLSLASGWNLISIPLTTGKTKAELFGQAQIFSMKRGSWQLLKETEVPDPTGSYWVNSSGGSVQLKGAKITGSQYIISPGVNFINYPLTEEKSVSGFFKEVMDDIELIAIYQDGWKVFDPSKPVELNMLSILKPGLGIIVIAKDDIVWKLDGEVLL